MPLFVLIRHAKSDRPPGVQDVERPLAERGISDARLLGRFLATALPRPGRVVSSPARRARDTAALVAGEAGWDQEPDIETDLYYGGVSDLLDVLRPGPEPVVAFGHEPTWSAAVSSLIGGGRIQMVTAAAAAVEGAARPGGCDLRWMVSPASLGGGSR